MPPRARGTTHPRPRRRCERCQERPAQSDGWLRRCVACEAELTQAVQTHTAWRLVDPDTELARLTTDLWIPPTSDWRRTFYYGEEVGPKHWQGSILEIISVQHDELVWALVFRGRAGWFPWIFRERGTHELRAYVRWNLWKPGIPSSLAVTWLPDRGVVFDYPRASAHELKELGKLANIKRRRGPQPYYPTPESFVGAVHRLYAKADSQGWDLRDNVKFTPEIIGGKLEPVIAERTLNDYLRCIDKDLTDLRERRI